ncbi:hypothetical protein F5B20DRAFT_520312 [Whalleya microplaca]|nr:hypothetical protein F5B20DRAFT_520312 [Whalleya microplaca]
MHPSLIATLMGVLSLGFANAAAVSGDAGSVATAEWARARDSPYEKRADPPRPPPNSPELITNTTPPPRAVLLCVSCMNICSTYNRPTMTAEEKVDFCLNHHCRPQGSCRGNVGDAYKTEFRHDPGGFAPREIVNYVRDVLFSQ